MEHTGTVDTASSPYTARLLPSGDEAGSAPGDRRFRPDVEGLRALSIIIVVLLHVGLPHMGGGVTGVDVFFVISGFVITGLLLRRQDADGRVGFLSFYARRARRLLPVSLLVILVSVVGTWLLSGPAEVDVVASDARWAAAFLANFQFAHVTPNVLVPRLTPLGAYWSLAVEEQFYLVYPALFAVLIWLPISASRRSKLTAGLALVALGSLAYSVAASRPGLFGPYVSIFARAWELAVGALVALFTVYAKRIPPRVGAVLSWSGLAAIIIGVTRISLHWAYPGYIALLPVLGTAAVIVGGTPAPSWGAERLLGLMPLRWIGRWSYSWYCWHLAVIVLLAEFLKTGEPIPGLSGVERFGLVFGTLVLAAATYFLFENPIRHSKFLADRPGATMIGAAALIASTILFTYAF